MQPIGACIFRVFALGVCVVDMQFELLEFVFDSVYVDLQGPHGRLVQKR